MFLLHKLNPKGVGQQSAVQESEATNSKQAQLNKI